MEHPGEIWQELNYNGERIGGIVPTEFDVEKIKLSYCANVMLYRFKDGEVEYLFQHRSKFLKRSPDEWDVSAGGHINLGENELDSIVRETQEEIGVKLEKSNLEIAASFLRWKSINVLYFYDWTSQEDNFNFNDKAVEEVKWVKYSKIEEFWSNLKQILVDDEIFKYYLKVWNEKILEKYENHRD